MYETVSLLGQLFILLSGLILLAMYLNKYVPKFVILKYTSIGGAGVCTVLIIHSIVLMGSLIR